MTQIRCLVYLEMNKSLIEVYWCQRRIGYLAKVDNFWGWAFEHPLNKKQYVDGMKFKIDAKKQFEAKFFSIFVDIEKKNENQMDHLKNLHLFPEIKND